MDPAATALEIDKYYDSLLFDGMSEQQLQWVEAQRAEAHRKYTLQVLGGSDFRRL